MNFHGKGSPLSAAGMDEVCDALGVSESEVWAVLTVETRGFGYLTDRRPQILFERHVFHRLTKGAHDNGNSDISNPKAGGYIGGTGEYSRLEKAMNLDESAALQSASWGIGQVMGGWANDSLRLKESWLFHRGWACLVSFKVIR